MTEKFCSHCHKSKDYSCFNLDLDNKSTQRMSWCKDCIKIYNRKYYLAHKKRPEYPTTLEVPDVLPHGKLNQVLPFLIKVSKNGPFKDMMLDTSLQKIKEELV